MLLQLSVIIVNYNVQYFVTQCLYSVQLALKNISGEIIVIDNNSTDGSKVYLAGRFPEVQFIWSKKNQGFSVANNLALQQARGEYVLFLNPDTLVAADCFEKCLAFAATKPAIGAMGVRMIDGWGRFLKESKRGLPSLLTSFYKLSGITALLPSSKIFARYYLGHLAEKQSAVVEVLSGAFMLVPKKVLEKTGGFDEQFFMYGEDIDLSYRIQLAGYTNYYFAETTIIHFKGESTKKGNAEYVRIFYGAMNLFVQKYYTGYQLKIYRWLIRAAITIKLFLLAIITGFNRSRAATVKPEATLIVAGESDDYSVTKLVNEFLPAAKVIGRVDARNGSPGNSLGGLPDLLPLVQQHQIKNIVFVMQQALTAKTAIEILEYLPPTLHCYFHFMGSGSIVASNTVVR